MTPSPSAPTPTGPRRVCVVVTARPSYARVKTALLALQRRPDVELQVVCTGSALLDRYGRVADVMRADGIPVTAEVHMLLEGETPLTSAKSTGIALMEMASTLGRLRPHIVTTIADRYETISTAIAASYMNIPLAHIQGGEVTGTIDEKVRHAVTKLADLHLVASRSARERVIRMGEDPAAVHLTGCPSVDLAAEVVANPRLDFDPIKKYGGVGADLDLSNGYLLVMQHPVTTEFHDARQQVMETLRAIQRLRMPTLWFWPNPDAGSEDLVKGIRQLRETGQLENVHFFKNMKPDDFLKVLYNARCLVGNSSVGIRESAFLGVPTVNIGTRQRGRERGHNVVDVDHDAAAIAAAIERQVGHGRYRSDDIYGDGKAGPRIAEMLATAPLTVEKRLTY